jgi:mannitol-1-phosphate 5-dehydrogenase
MPEILVCGAGKIGRGFIGQLFHRAGWSVRFVDGVAAVVDGLNRERRYRVDIAGRPELTEYIPVAGACRLDDAAALAAAVARADLIACAVGAPNLAGLAKALAPALRRRDLAKPLDWLICENADKPAETLRKTLLEGAEPALAEFVASRLGLVETQVLRSGMPADPEIAAREPLAVKMHDWWTLPCDAEAFRGAIPQVEGLRPRANFGNELTRKIYTFNGLNGPISFLGWANGYRVLHEAARAEALQPLLRGVAEESGHGLIREFGFDPEEHRAFQRIAWEKYRDASLADAIERNARDSARKLGARERLLGPATLCLKHGREPVAYAAAIAAAIAYDGSDDAGTRAVRETLAREGAAGVLARHCGLAPDAPLARLVLDAWTRRAHLVTSSTAGKA